MAKYEIFVATKGFKKSKTFIVHSTKAADQMHRKLWHQVDRDGNPRWGTVVTKRLDKPTIAVKGAAA
jgi:hypothetical protein